jgi:hypothetical protein
VITNIERADVAFKGGLASVHKYLRLRDFYKQMGSLAIFRRYSFFMGNDDQRLIVYLIPAVKSMVRAVIEAMVIVSGIIGASMVVIIFVSEIVIVIAVSVMAWRVGHRFTAKSDGETLGLRFVWSNGQQCQHCDHKDNEIFHRVLIVN